MSANTTARPLSAPAESGSGGDTQPASNKQQQQQQQEATKSSSDDSCAAACAQDADAGAAKQHQRQAEAKRPTSSSSTTRPQPSARGTRKNDKEGNDPGEDTSPRTTTDTSFDALPQLVRAHGVPYLVERVLANGSFGVVFSARCESSGETVAIKRVLQDKRYKNRELQIMRALHHPNVVELKNSFYTNSSKGDDVYLNLVLEFVPVTMHKFARDYARRRQQMPLALVKLFTYQLARALGYLHTFSVCHRDIKPQNLLLDPSTSVLKLCDFGSAKVLQRTEQNVSYICSRYYRAPELIFGSTFYTTAIDIWSLGCVLAELLLGQPLFPGNSSVDQLVEIIKVLGTPSSEQIQAMNKNYPAYSFPDIKPTPWSKVFKNCSAPPEAIDLVARVLQYMPVLRPTALEICAHPFFDELRNTPDLLLPSGCASPPLVNFTPEELAAMKQQGLEHKLMPEKAPASHNDEQSGTPTVQQPQPQPLPQPQPPAGTPSSTPACTTAPATQLTVTH
eukprot:TRINITY_DN722_c2_g1_i3.p1 TRINITY_DN722_c2_g1~~TRINITY_DN722_c2_g1_i3.p1  ORF type:complete len:506 (-),score=129.71 TRINITY_DN722_c2_g1_i3:1738-3255(-)